MITSPRRIALGLALSFIASLAFAQATPTGLWKSIDDGTKKEKSLVRIVEDAGVYSGKVEKTLDPATPPDAACKACTDERKDKPIVGMTIIRNIRQDSDDKTLFGGGEILDPNNGKVYKLRLRPIDNGARLEVRGYIGMPMLGRTQVWTRVE